MNFYQNCLFPLLLEAIEDTTLAEARAETLAPLSGDEILEIGIGSGHSLKHYPAHIRSLTAIEPSRALHKRALGRATKARISLNLSADKGECLPFPSHRFDEVVILLVLCSAHSVEQLLSEVRRVLRPGGRVLFLEHVRSNHPRVFRWQKRLNPINRRLGCGCELVRNSAASLRLAGFKLDQLEERSLSTPHTLFPMIRGVATLSP